MNDSRDATEDLPRAIAERLASETSIAMLTPRVDAAVLAAARAQFAERRRRRRFRVPAAMAATLVVALAAAVLLSQRFGSIGDSTTARNSSGAPAELAPSFDPADDVDGSGRVDILDAFALARADNDTSAGRARVAALAARIVSLDATERAL